MLGVFQHSLMADLSTDQNSPRGQMRDFLLFSEEEMRRNREETSFFVFISAIMFQAKSSILN